MKESTKIFRFKKTRRKSKEWRRSWRKLCPKIGLNKMKGLREKDES